MVLAKRASPRYHQPAGLLIFPAQGMVCPSRAHPDRNGLDRRRASSASRGGKAVEAGAELPDRDCGVASVPDDAWQTTAAATVGEGPSRQWGPKPAPSVNLQCLGLQCQLDWVVGPSARATRAWCRERPRGRSRVGKRSGSPCFQHGRSVIGRQPGLPGAIDDLAATVITPSNDGRLRIDTHGVAGKSVAFGAKNNYVADFPPNKSD
jgi:hypothetical protein